MNLQRFQFYTIFKSFCLVFWWWITDGRDYAPTAQMDWCSRGSRRWIFRHIVLVDDVKWEEQSTRFSLSWHTINQWKRGRKPKMPESKENLFNFISMERASPPPRLGTAFAWNHVLLPNFNMNCHINTVIYAVEQTAFCYRRHTNLVISVGLVTARHAHRCLHCYYSFAIPPVATFHIHFSPFASLYLMER